MEVSGMRIVVVYWDDRNVKHYISVTPEELKFIRERFDRVEIL
jgi:hypothetical protein